MHNIFIGTYLTKLGLFFKDKVIDSNLIIWIFGGTKVIYDYIIEKKKCICDKIDLDKIKDQTRKIVCKLEQIDKNMFEIMDKEKLAQKIYEDLCKHKTIKQLKYLRLTEDEIYEIEQYIN